MSERRITWNLMRTGYLVVGVVAASASAYLSFSSDRLNPFLPAAIAVIILALAFVASDYLLDRLGRLFVRRQGPK
jgi:hypothetical protein